MFTLYYKPTCPFCQRVLQVSDNLGVEFDLRDISEDESAREELIEKGGKQQVPFLVDAENDVSMYESSDIIDYVRENGKKSEGSSEAKPRIHVGGSTCVSCEG
jgi:glutathione S-transferase